MRKNVHYQYYVESEDEKTVLNALKTELQCIQSGRIDKFNVIQKHFNIAHIRPLKQNTIVVLVYDTDVENTDILEQNIRFLKKQKAVKKIVCIPQVKNLEEELVHSCDIRNITELTHSSSKKDYKRDLINCSNLGTRLKKCGFDITKFWSCTPQNEFEVWGNDAEKIKIK